MFLSSFNEKVTKGVLILKVCIYFCMFDAPKILWPELLECTVLVKKHPCFGQEMFLYRDFLGMFLQQLWCSQLWMWDHNFWSNQHNAKLLRRPRQNWDLRIGSQNWWCPPAYHCMPMVLHCLLGKYLFPNIENKAFSYYHLLKFLQGWLHKS